MKHALYTLSGAVAAERGLADVFGPEEMKDGKPTGNRPLIRKGLEVKTPEAESMDEFLTLMEDGKQEHALKLAQGQLDIIRQRKIREAAEDKTTAAILNGEKIKLDTDLEGIGAVDEEVNFGDYSEEDRREAVRLRCQAVGDAYLYGSRGPSTGAGKVVKEKAAKVTKLEAQAAAGELSDEEIATLKKLGLL